MKIHLSKTKTRFAVLTTVCLLAPGCFAAPPAAPQADALPTAYGLDARGKENIVFPDDAGVIDVTKAPYKADNTGKTDATAAIQKALEDYPALNKIIYLPNGTYRVSGQINWPSGVKGRSDWKNAIVQGQSRDGVVVRLQDNAPGFQDPAKRKWVFWTGGPPAQRFRNSIRNLTINTGKGNRGASPLWYNASNQGSARELLLTDGDDGKGGAELGLDLTAGEIGPCFIKNVEVRGYDVGIRSRQSINAVTLENIVISGQRKIGIDNSHQILPVRGLISRNSVPAIQNVDADGTVALIDSQLIGTGDASQVPAIINDGRSCILFARNVQVSGYGQSIENKAGTGQGVAQGDITEFVSHPPISAFPSVSKSLNLPIKETPSVPWDDLKDWANVNDFKQPDDKDDTKAIQRAIDSGKTTVYFPNRLQSKGKEQVEIGYTFSEQIHVRGAVRRLIGCEARLRWGGPVPEDNNATSFFRIEDGAAPVVVLERFSFGFSKGPTSFQHATKRAVVLSSISEARYRNDGGTGDLFLEDFGGGASIFDGNQTVYARQFNPEAQTARFQVIGPAKMWIFGVKTEPGGPMGVVKDGGTLELIGAFQYVSQFDRTQTGFFDLENAGPVSVAAASQYVWTPSWSVKNPINETRDGKTVTLYNNALIPRGNTGAIALFTSRPVENAGPEPEKPVLKIVDATAKSVRLQVELPANAQNIAGVKLFRGDQPIQTVWNGEVTDAGLEVDTAYNYRAVTFTTAGAQSEAATAAARTIKDIVAPTLADALERNRISDRMVGLRWKPAKDEIGVTGYKLSRLSGTVTDWTEKFDPNTLRFYDTKAKAGQEYTYRLTAFDAAGNVSPPQDLKVSTLPEPAKEVDVIAVGADIVKAAANQGADIGGIGQTSWIVYRAIPFGGIKPFNRIRLKYGAPGEPNTKTGSNGAKMLFYTDVKEGVDEKGKPTFEGGKLIATHTVVGTGGWGKMDAREDAFNAPDAGVHDVYITFEKGDSPSITGYMNLRSFTFFSGVPPP